MNDRMVVAVLGIGVLALARPAFCSRDWVYRGKDCEIIYRYAPKTGTLHDLQVIFNGGSPFYPSNYGGPAEVQLGGEKFWNWDGKHESKLLSESHAKGVTTAVFRWIYNSDSLDFKVRVWLEGKTLKSEWTASSSKVLSFSLDRTENTANPKIVELPYGHSVLFVEGTFISAWLDRQTSNASEIWPMREIFSKTSAYFSDQALYKTLTDGRRYALRETVSLTVSPEITQTFFVPQNPISPYRKALSNYFIADSWHGGNNSFAQIKDCLELFVPLGIRNLWIILHDWQRYGYDNGLPTTYPASQSKGGSSGIKAIADLCSKQGWLFSLHTNYRDFYENSDDWNPADVALDSSGHWIKAWYNPITKIQSYLMKPSRALTYAKIYEPLIHRNYYTTSAYLDCNSGVVPSYYMDYDARIANSGRQKAAFVMSRDVMTYLRQVHGGPVAGEGKGTAAAVWAGFIDAVEADPRSIWQDRDVNPEGSEGSNVPAIVDYKLKVLHALFVPHGVGYFNRFFKSRSSGDYSRTEFARYFASEIAFGNAAFFDYWYLIESNHEEFLRKYRFMSVLQKHYLDAEIKTIGYYRNGAFQTLSQALKAILPSCAMDRVQSTLLEELAILRLEYSKALVVYVNRSKARTLNLTINGAVFTLRPNDFLALKRGKPVAYAAERDGIYREWITAS